MAPNTPIGRAPSWRFEPVSLTRDRERKAFQVAYSAAVPYLTGVQADQVTAARVFTETLSREASGTSTTMAQMEVDARIRAAGQRAFAEQVRAAAAADARKTAQAVEDKTENKRKSGFTGAFSDLVQPFVEAGESLSDVVTGDWKGAASNLGEAGLATLNAFDVPGRYIVRPAIEELTGYDVQAYLDNPDANPFAQVLLGAATDPLTYLGPGALSGIGKAAARTVAPRLAAQFAGRSAPGVLSQLGRVGAGLLESPYKATLAGVVGGAVGAQVGSWVGGETGEMVGGISAGLAAGVVAGYFATPGNRARPAGNYIVDGKERMDALLHQIEYELGIDRAPLAPEELSILDELTRSEGYQPSFAEAIPSKSAITGVPVAWAKAGKAPDGTPMLRSFAEYMNDPSKSRHGGTEPNIVVNDELMAMPSNTARNLYLRQTVMAHEEAHHLWDTALTDDIRTRVTGALLGPDVTVRGVQHDITRRWGALSVSRRADEAFAEAWASMQAGRDNVYTRVLGDIVESVVKTLPQEVQSAVYEQRALMREWLPRVETISSEVARDRSAKRSPYQLIQEETLDDWFDMMGPDGSLYGFVRRLADGKFSLTSYVGDSPEETFDRLSDAQRWVKDHEPQLSEYDKRRPLPFNTGEKPLLTGEPRRWLPDRVEGPQDGNTSTLVEPRAQKRLWFHGTSSRRTDFALPDPAFGVGQQTAITQGPGIYMSADAKESMGYGNRLFVTEFDGVELNLTQANTVDEYIFALDGTWDDVRMSMATKWREAGFGKVADEIERAWGGVRGGGPEADVFRRTDWTAFGGPKGKSTAYGYRELLARAVKRGWEAEGGYRFIEPDSSLSHAQSKQEVTRRAVDAGLLGEWGGQMVKNPFTAGGPDATVRGDHFAMAATHQALKERGVDAVFHASYGDGDVLIVLNGEKVRAVLDFQGSEYGGGLRGMAAQLGLHPNPDGATLEDFKRAGARQVINGLAATKVNFREIRPVSNITERFGAIEMGTPDASGRRLDIGSWYQNPDHQSYMMRFKPKPFGPQIDMHFKTLEEAEAYVDKHVRPEYLAEAMSRRESLSARSFGGRRASMPDPDDEPIARILNGRAVGAPPGIVTRRDLNALEARLTQAAKDSAGSRFWYTNSGRAFLQAAGGDVEFADRIARIAAFTSPQEQVLTQGAKIARGIERMLRGESLAGLHVPSMDKRLEMSMNLSGPEWDAAVVDGLKNKGTSKTWNFYVDLLEDIDPERARKYRFDGGGTATIDLWMARAFGYDRDQVSERQYQFMGETFQRLADQLGWSAREVQAAVWVNQRVKFDPEAPADLASFDYRDAMLATVGQVSQETLPGKEWTGGVRRTRLSGAEHLPYQTQNVHHQQVMEALHDDNGFDILARMLGVMRYDRFLGAGIYGGEVNPGTQLQVGVGARVESGYGMGLDANAAERVDAYSALLGYILEQDAAAWHRPWFSKTKPHLANAVELSFSRTLSPAEAVALERALDARMRQDPPSSFKVPVEGKDGKWELKAVTPTKPKGADEPLFTSEFWGRQIENGVAVVPGPSGTLRIFRPPTDTDRAARTASTQSYAVKDPVTKKSSVEGVNAPGRVDSDWGAVGDSNLYFRSLVYDAMQEALPDTGLDAKLKFFATDGGYISHNDWGSTNHGEHYLSVAGRFLGPDVRAVVEDLKRRVADIDEAFAREHSLGRYAKGGTGNGSPDPAVAAAERRLSAPDPSKPTFVGMTPSEIAEIIGIDRTNKELMDTIRTLDGLYSRDALTPEQEATRMMISNRLRREYAALNNERDAVWLVKPGARQAMRESMEQRANAMREAGYTEEQVREALPQAFDVWHGDRHASGSLRGYVGDPNYRRYMQLERIASNPNANPVMRDKARKQLYGMAGMEEAANSPDSVTARSLEEQLQASLDQLDPDRRQSRDDLVLRMGTPREFGYTDEQTAAATHERTWPRRAYENMVDILNLPRVMMSSYDLSGMGRQGILLGIAHPKEWRASVAAQFKAMKSQQVAEAIQESIYADPFWSRATAAKLYDAKWGKYADEANEAVAGSGTNAREEAYFSRWASKIPGIRASERAYAVGLNKQRFDTFRNIVASWDEAGVIPDGRREEQLARFINAATGRGDIGVFNDAGRLLSAFFFSPRFLISRVQAPAMLLYGDSLVRRQVARSLASFVGIGTGVLTMLHLATEAGIIDGNVEWDPRSSEFGKIKIGNTRYDFWAGYQPLARYTAQVLSGQAKYGDQVVDVERSAVIGRFFRGKMSPVAAAAYNLINGEVQAGEDFEPGSADFKWQMANFAGGLVMPLLMQEVIDAYKEDGLGGAVKTLPSGIGLGAQTYTPASHELDREAKLLLNMDPEVKARYPDGIGGYFDLQPQDRDRVKSENPDIWRRYVDNSGQSTKRADEIRTQVTQQQQSLDEKLLAGVITREDWADAVSDLQKEAGIRISEVYGDKKLDPDELENPLDRYRYVIQQATDETTSLTDWDLVNEWLEAQPEEDKTFISENTGLSGTPLTRLYREMRSKYFDMPRYIGMSADNGAKVDELYQEVLNHSSSRDDAAMLGALARVQLGWDPVVVAGVRRKIFNILIEDPRRTQFRQTNALAVLMDRGRLTPAQAARVNGLLGTKDAA